MRPLERLLPHLRNVRRNVACCPAHDDGSPSLSIRENGRGDVLLHCFAGCTVDAITAAVGMTPRDLFADATPSRGFSPPTPPRAMAAPLDVVTSPGIDDAIVRAFADALLMRPELLAEMRERRGWTREAVARLDVGIVPDRGGWRFTFPVRDDEGIIRNILRYRPGADASKVLPWRKGYGSPRLWPLSSLTRSDVIIVAGPSDCLCAHSFGLTNAVTGTGGEATWRDEWTPRFRDKDVAIIYDVDDAGRAGADNVARKLTGTALRVRVVTLPVERPAKDLTDYLHVLGHGADALRNLIAATPSWRPSVRPVGGRAVRPVRPIAATNIGPVRPAGGTCLR